MIVGPKSEGFNSRVSGLRVPLRSHVPGSRVSGLRVTGLRVPGLGSQVLILDYAMIWVGIFQVGIFWVRIFRGDFSRTGPIIDVLEKLFLIINVVK